MWSHGIKRGKHRAGGGVRAPSGMARAPCLGTDTWQVHSPRRAGPLPLASTQTPRSHCAPPGRPSSLCLGARTHHCLGNSQSSFRTPLRHHFLRSPPSPTPPHLHLGQGEVPFPSPALAPCSHLTIVLYPRMVFALFLSAPPTRQSSLRVETGSHITQGNLVSDLVFSGMWSAFLACNWCPIYLTE